MKIKYMLRPEALVGLAIDSLAVTGGRLHAGQVHALAACNGTEPVGVMSESDLLCAVA
jgi:hypothetical protein